jgi:hypothetical protein
MTTTTTKTKTRKAGKIVRALADVIHTAATKQPQPFVDLDVTALVKRLERRKALAKRAYDECDQIEAELIRRINETGSGTGCWFLTDGRMARVVDNFVDKHGQPRLKAWGHAAVKRFEIEVVGGK